MIKNGEAKAEFEGRFDGLAIRGTMLAGPQELYMARMLSTDVSSLKGYAPTALPPAIDVFEKAISAMKDRPNPEEVIRISRDHRTSPVSVEALSTFLSMQAKAGFSDAVVGDLINEYLECAKVWGPRMVARAEQYCGEQLVTARRMPKEALKHLALAEELLRERSSEPNPQIQAFREAAEIQISLNKSQSDSSDDRAAAYKELQSALKAQPFNAEILLALARFGASNQLIDEAIGYYSDLVALPLLEQFLLSQRAGQPAGDPTPSESLKQLWIERHGSDAKLEAFLAEHCETRLTELTREIREKAGDLPKVDQASTHTVLVELFTGGLCYPCVAADVGLTAIAETYPTTDVITLRYHQHIPGPDGLANQDSEDRFAFYEGAGTPTFAVDGLVLDPRQVPYAGPLQMTPTAYGILRQVVDRRRLQATPVQLQLDATVANEELSIRAEALGVPEDLLPSLKLRMALAESGVVARMPNGIRRHEMIVREMPGSARGIAPKKGELKYSFSMPVSDLQKHLDEYIQRYEAGNKLEFPAEMKPPVRGQLFLVAWIQNDKVDEKNPLKLVLQTAMVPVSGLTVVDGVSTKPVQSPANGSPETSVKDSATPPAPALPE